MSMKESLYNIKNRFHQMEKIRISLPPIFAFKDHDVYDFEPCLEFFDWSYTNRAIEIDLKTCTTANYQAMALLVAYAWKLRNQGCTVSFNENQSDIGASSMWRLMGARGLFQVAIHENQNFKSKNIKPLIAIRNSVDLKNAISSAEIYTNNFDIEYTKTLRYVLSELLYNTLEHGQSFFDYKGSLKRVPSLIQFTWYQKSNELHFIIADTGIGIKKHIEKAYPGQESSEAAIRQAIKPQVSGTFGSTDPYKEKNNAGAGLFISTNIIKRLNADMYIISGDGLLHISPRDITGKTINANWPGTFVLVSLKLDNHRIVALHEMMQEFREEAMKEQQKGDRRVEEESFYFSISNHFGKYAEDKEAAIKFRDRTLFPQIYENKSIQVDFESVISAPHSFLSGLFASPVKYLGMKSYKKIKILNANPEIRETLDFIWDENTAE